MEGTTKVAKFIGNKDISIAASSGVAISREFGRRRNNGQKYLQLAAVFKSH